MEARIFRFSTDITGDMDSYITYPVYDEFKKLVGGFTVFRGSVIAGFISGVGYPLALKVSTGESFYFTVYENIHTHRVSYGRVTEKPINDESKKVSCASEEDFSEQ